jgi:hypothetical protein
MKKRLKFIEITETDIMIIVKLHVMQIVVLITNVTLLLMITMMLNIVSDLIAGKSFHMGMVMDLLFCTVFFLTCGVGLGGKEKHPVINL